MELYRGILMHVLMGQDTTDSFSDLSCVLSRIVESTCYKTLQKIKAIIQDDSLEDSECFMKIEEIICALEEIGSSGGNRHDFG